MFTHDISRALEGAIGKDGASDADFADALAKANDAVKRLDTRRKDGSLPILALPERESDLAIVEETAARIAHNFKALIVVGMGGSSYGGKTLTALAHNPFTRQAGISLHFLDNIDPYTSNQLLLTVDLKVAMFLLVSKSGDTAETLAHALLLVQEVESRLGKDAVRNHFIAITEPRDSALQRMAAAYGMEVLEHDTGIGGRFAALTNVGLLPARVAGLDIRAVRKGAAEVVRRTFAAKDSEPARGAPLPPAKHWP